jgi:hypothetical protein
VVVGWCASSCHEDIEVLKGMGLPMLLIRDWSTWKLKMIHTDVSPFFVQSSEHSRCACAGWRNFFPVVLLCQFLVLAGNRFWFRENR